MKYRRLRVCNWEIFHDEHEIQFSTDSDKPVTIIFGANGGGKTSLLVAMYWCLYGALDVDKAHSRVTIGELFNQRAQDAIPAGSSDTAWVELELDIDPSEENTYIVRREITAKRSVKGDIAFGEAVTLMERQGQDIFSHASSALVDNVLRKALARHFFHASEQMHFPFAMNDSDAQALLRNAIFNIVGQEELDVVISQTEKAVERLEKARRDIADEVHEVEELEANVERLRIALDDKRGVLAGKELERRAAIELLDGHLERLASVREFEPLVARRNACVSDLDAKRELSEACERTVSAYSKDLWRVPAGAAVEAFNSWYEPRAEHFPAIVNANLIAYMKQTRKCICGREAGPEHVAHVRELLEGLEDDALARLSSLFNSTKDWAGGVADLTQRFREARVAQVMAERAVADAEAALRVAEDDLIARGKGPVEEDVEQLQANVDGLRTKRDRLQGECDVLQTGIDNDAALHRQAEADRANAAQDPNLRVAEARVRAARLLLDLARDTKATHATFVRPRLQDTMNDHYWTFKGDRRVMVTEDWQILAVDEMPDGTEVPVRPSQSETNLLCFAFAAATARLIPQFRLAGDANIPGADHAAAAGTYPLAVDAPLASFEDDYKRGVVDALPESLDQVVLMNGAVDLHHFEEMRINGSIGKAYAVRYTGPLKDLPGGREVNTSFEFADQEITYLENGPPELKRSEILELDVGS